MVLLTAWHSERAVVISGPLIGLSRRIVDDGESCRYQENIDLHPYHNTSVCGDNPENHPCGIVDAHFFPDPLAVSFCRPPDLGEQRQATDNDDIIAYNALAPVMKQPFIATSNFLTFERGRNSFSSIRRSSCFRRGCHLVESGSGIGDASRRSCSHRCPEPALARLRC